MMKRKSNDLVFYTNPRSRGRIVRWMLEEVGAPYETEILEFGTTMKAPEYLAINPMGKVPAIRHGNAVVTESAAICAYLADAYPDAGLAPSLSDRASYYRWLFFAAGPLESAITNRSLGFEVPQDREMTAGYGNLTNALNALESAIAGSPYVAGQTFSAADVYVGSQISWGLAFGTIDSFLIWRLTEGKVHATDATNASRTLLFDIGRQQWDEALLKAFDIPAALLPEVKDCAADYGATPKALLGKALPIRGVAQLSRFLDWFLIDGFFVGVPSLFGRFAGRVADPLRTGVVQFYLLSFLLATAVLLLVISQSAMVP